MRTFFLLSLTAAITLLGIPSGYSQSASSPMVLNSGGSAGPFSDARGSVRYFVLNVPPQSTNATFAITGSTGDCDLYVKLGSVPTTSSWTYRPYRNTSNETVSVANPAAGAWYVMLRAYSTYTNVTLRASYTGGATQTASAPVFNPAPGTFSGQVSVGVTSSTPNSVIRFTTNGTTPTTASEVYNAPIVVTATTTIQAITTATGFSNSGITSGTYTINTGSGMTPLANNTPVPNLSGAQNSQQNYRLAVPVGQTSLTITLSGGTGDADLYVKYGQQATTSVWDYRPFVRSNAESVTIANPQAGDWFIMVHGFAAYSGVSLNGAFTGSTGGTRLPDLAFYAGSMNPRITTETFSSAACEIEEGTITAGTHKLLRFSTETRNIGTADLVLGNPATNPGFVWGSCHGHYHFNSFAQYRLLDSTGASIVRTGRKVGFCLMDISRHNTSANPSARYNCSNQGIQAGWADVYSSNLSGQWIDITGLASGSYILEVIVDPMNVIAELDETNNTTRVPVTIP